MLVSLDCGCQQIFVVSLELFDEVEYKITESLGLFFVGSEQYFERSPFVNVNVVLGVAVGVGMWVCFLLTLVFLNYLLYKFTGLAQFDCFQHI